MSDSDGTEAVSSVDEKRDGVSMLRLDGQGTTYL